MLLACLVAGCALALLGAGSSLANSNPNCSGSAGDSQYVDPLGCLTTSTSTSTPPPPTTSSATPPPTTTPAAVASGTTSTPVPSDPKSSHHGSLPYTGLDILPALALGISLFGAGFLLRRRAASS